MDPELSTLHCLIWLLPKKTIYLQILMQSGVRNLSSHPDCTASCLYRFGWNWYEPQFPSCKMGIPVFPIWLISSFTQQIFFGQDKPWRWYNCAPDVVMILKDQSLAIGTKRETRGHRWQWEMRVRSLALGAWMQVPHDEIQSTKKEWPTCHQGTNAYAPMVSTEAPRSALGLPFGCGKDKRSGLRNHFPIAHQSEPEAKFLFPWGFAHGVAYCSWGHSLITQQWGAWRGRLYLKLYESISFHLCCYSPSLSHYFLSSIQYIFLMQPEVPFEYCKPPVSA